MSEFTAAVWQEDDLFVAQCLEVDVASQGHTEEEALAFKNLNINYFSCLPPYNQEGAREALESPLSRQSIAEMLPEAGIARVERPRVAE